MNNYIFNGICGYDNQNYDICITAKTLDDAWQIISINYPEFYRVSFVKEEKL